jgi:BON domain
MRPMHRLAFTAIAMLFTVATLSAQSARTDGQIENDIESQVANSQALSGQAIGIYTHGGIVTLSGQVKDEETRKAAVAMVQKVDGVQSVENHLVLPGEALPADQAEQADQAAQADQGTAANQPAQPDQSGPADQPTLQQPAPGQQPQYPQPSDNRASNYPQQPDNGYPPPPPRYPYPNRAQRPYSDYPQQTRLQSAVGTVTLDPGTPINVRISQGLDTRHTQPGTVFRAVTAQNVFVNGYVAIPRGTTVTGTVVDVKTSGDFKGSPKLQLQLTSVTLDNTNYALQSNIWSRKGPGKGQEVIGNTIGGAALGAVIGAIAGGGPGAAIGAGVGGVAAAGVTGAIPARDLLVRPESVLTFSLAAPATVQPVPQDELDRLVAQQQDQRMNAPRYGYPPPPPPRPYGYGYPYPPPPPPPYPYYRYYR